MSDLTQRLRGKYSVGKDGVYEDRDFGSFTPAICKDAAERIEQLEHELKSLNQRLDFYEERVASAEGQSEVLAEHLSAIHNLIQPSPIATREGLMEFLPEKDLPMYWRGLSRAIREIPEKIERSKQAKKKYF